MRPFTTELADKNKRGLDKNRRHCCKRYARISFVFDFNDFQCWYRHREENKRAVQMPHSILFEYCIWFQFESFWTIFLH